MVREVCRGDIGDGFWVHSHDLEQLVHISDRTLPFLTLRLCTSSGLGSRTAPGISDCVTRLEGEGSEESRFEEFLPPNSPTAFACLAPGGSSWRCSFGQKDLANQRSADVRSRLQWLSHLKTAESRPLHYHCHTPISAHHGSSIRAFGIECHTKVMPAQSDRALRIREDCPPSFDHPLTPPCCTSREPKCDSTDSYRPQLRKPLQPS